ncbi:neurofilament light protein [Tasmannia lanceolata]|uniref:neurofilament light protein n=1 Tax=Tasmannia lanceolata TaxID=3420 RepID=UPI004062D32E
MASEGMDDFGSLFEGMVLIDPTSSSSPTSSTLEIQNHQSSQPLDLNLFTDLTLLPSQNPPPPQSQSPHHSHSNSASEINQSSRPIISRKKKRGAVRIGYGRDSNPDSDPKQIHHSLSTSDSLPSPAPSIHPLVSQTDSFMPTDPQHHPPSLSLANSDNASHTISNAPHHESPNSHSPLAISVIPLIDEIRLSESELPEKPTSSEKRQVEEEEARDASRSALNGENLRKENEESIKQMHSEEEYKGRDVCSSVEEKLELIRAKISREFEKIRETAASVSSSRKESAKKRREATNSVNLASIKYKELEKELEEACEAEDFERAERVSESLAATEKEKEGFLIMLRDAEADSDSVDSEMQRLLELQIAAEEEASSLLEHLAKDAANNADLLMKNAEESSSKEIEEWLSSTETLEIKKVELEIQSHLINDARLGLKDSIEHSIADDRKEKEALSEKQAVLREELDVLLTLVRSKEAEIAENDHNIKEVEKRIESVTFGFQEAQSSIDTMYDGLQVGLSHIELEANALSNKKKEVDEVLSLEEERRSKLKELSLASANEAKACHELVGLRKILAASILKSREDKVRLAKTEEKILEEVLILRQQVSEARASLQELSSTRASIQQEIASSRQRISFIDKRGPELEAEKKVAAAARNFKEAGRIATESKALSIEKESIQNKMESSILELEKVEEEIKGTVNKLQESERLILSKEEEAAMAGYERLQLVAAAAMAERSAALELGDLEEANILLAEAESANSDAENLQKAYDLKVKETVKTPKHFVSMTLIANLAGQRLAEMAASVRLSLEGGSQLWPTGHHLHSFST